MSDKIKLNKIHILVGLISIGLLIIAFFLYSDLSKKRAEALENQGSSLIKRNLDNFLPSAKETIMKEYPQLPEYYVEHLLQKSWNISNINKEIDNGMSAIFITDYHEENNTGNSPAVIQWLVDHNDIDSVVFGGDVFNKRESIEESVEALNNFKAMMSSYGLNENLYIVVGNHEYDNPSAKQKYFYKQLTDLDLISFVFDNHPDDVVRMPDGVAYYRDDNDQKVRYYYIPCNYVSQIDEAVYDWFYSTTESIPNDYKVIVYSHLAIREGAVNPYFQTIADCLETMNTSGVIGYKDQIYDYTGKNINVVCVVCGHAHKDQQFISQSGIHYLEFTCDTYTQAHDYERIPGTVTEQAVVVIQIDFDKRCIYLTRIGVGEDQVLTW